MRYHSDDDKFISICVFGIIILYFVTIIGLIIYFSNRPKVSNATVITPTDTYENCRVRCFDRNSIDLTTQEGESVRVQGTATIKWK